MITRGFIKMFISDFDAFNQDASNRMFAYTGDTTMTNYTNYSPDSDPLYCWARVEEEFTTKVMTDKERDLIKTYEDAINNGMVVQSD